MSVYVDKARNTFGCMLMCHMIADTLSELHQMADKIGLKREWFQGEASFPHYDIAQTKHALAVTAGAIEVDYRQLAGHMKRIRADGAAAGLI